jgi:phosphatidate cytidylyltransferase
MKRVLTAVVLIPLVLLILFKGPDWLYSIFIGAIAFLAANEYFGIAEKYQANLYRYLVLVAVGLYFLGHALFGIDAFGVAGFGSKYSSLIFDLTGFRVFPLVLLALGLFAGDIRRSLPAAAISYFGFLYVAYTLGEISLTGHYPNGRILVFVFLVAVWSGDTFAYYVGRAFGKHKLAPAISPGKTWEGAIASAVGATLITTLLFQHIHGMSNLLVRLDALPSRSVLYADAGVYSPPWWMAAAFGISVNIAAQIGDLAESALKRGAGVKDSGTLLPGHGGILDRIDALLLAAPVLWYFGLFLLKAMNHHS